MHAWFRWENWLIHGKNRDGSRWGQKDLELVIRYIKRRMKDGFRHRESLKLSLLLEPDRFSEDISIAKSEERAAKSAGDPARNAVLAASGRTKPIEITARTPAQIMAENEKIAALLKAWKEKNL